MVLSGACHCWQHRPPVLRAQLSLPGPSLLPALPGEPSGPLPPAPRASVPPTQPQTHLAYLISGYSSGPRQLWLLWAAALDHPGGQAPPCHYTPLHFPNLFPSLYTELMTLTSQGHEEQMNPGQAHEDMHLDRSPCPWAECEHLYL